MKKFETGEVFLTPGAARVLEESGQTHHPFLHKHVTGNWGSIHPGDSHLNERAIVNGSTIMSIHTTLKGVVLWVITDPCGSSGEREATTLLLPEEY